MDTNPSTLMRFNIAVFAGALLTAIAGPLLTDDKTPENKETPQAVTTSNFTPDQP